MANEPIIEVEGLTKVFHMGGVDVPALRGVDLSAKAGEFLAVLGPSGSGKSTLFHIIGGLTPPSAGKVRVAGRDLTMMTDGERTSLRRTGVGFVFQRFNLLPTLTAAENIEIAKHIAGNRGEDASFQEVLGLLGIEHRLHHKPYALSGGEQQRVAIARAIDRVAGGFVLSRDESGTAGSDRGSGLRLTTTWQTNPSSKWKG